MIIDLDLIERKLVSSTWRHQAHPLPARWRIVLTLEHYTELYYSITKEERHAHYQSS
jgi:hypothetical protein